MNYEFESCSETNASIAIRCFTRLYGRTRIPPQNLCYASDFEREKIRPGGRRSEGTVHAFEHWLRAVLVRASSAMPAIIGSQQQQTPNTINASQLLWDASFGIAIETKDNGDFDRA